MDPLVFTILCVIGICVLFYFTERLLIKYNFGVSNEVLSIYFNVVGVLYTLVLAFVVVTVWQNYQATVTAVENEAHQLMDLREEAENIPGAYREQIIEATVQYARAVRQDEWPSMALRMESPHANDKMDQLIMLRNRIGQELLQGDVDGEAIQDVREYIKQLREFRHDRILSSHSQLPGLLWLVLITGSVNCLALSFLIHVKNILWQTILTTVMTSVLALVLYLIFSLSNPFTGSAMISPHSFTEVENGGHAH